MYARHESGVYLIRNLLNGKVYVGSAINPEKRWGQHRTDLRTGAHANRHLQASWQAHGEGAFEFVVLERASPATLLEREQHYIDTLDAVNPARGYNLHPLARSSLGVKRSEATREKLRVAALARVASGGGLTRADQSRGGQTHRGVKRGPMSEEQKGRIRETLGGRPKSPGHRREISLALKGRVFSDAHKEKLKQAALRQWASR